MDCISEGKVRLRYEFGTKVSVATTLTTGFTVSKRALPGNPFDGHTLGEAIEQVETLTDQRISLNAVDHGYRGHGVEATTLPISDTHKDVPPALARLHRRSSAIEPEIVHTKSDGRVARCPLMGTIGGAIFAVMCACDYYTHKILAHLRAIRTAIFDAFLAVISAGNRRPYAEIAA